MDLYVERQAIEQMKAGDASKFLLLFDENFTPLYRYVLRRVFDTAEAERITRMTFLDALGQIQNTPMDTSYTVWLYSLAKPRVWDYLARNNEAAKAGIVYDVAAVKRAKKRESYLQKLIMFLGNCCWRKKKF
jgi:DNA-directed RNA polymerase specialized sigma24 family protein